MAGSRRALTLADSMTMAYGGLLTSMGCSDFALVDDGGYGGCCCCAEECECGRSRRRLALEGGGGSGHRQRRAPLLVSSTRSPKHCARLSAVAKTSQKLSYYLLCEDRSDHCTWPNHSPWSAQVHDSKLRVLNPQIVRSCRPPRPSWLSSSWLSTNRPPSGSTGRTRLTYGSEDEAVHYHAPDSAAESLDPHVVGPVTPAGKSIGSAPLKLAAFGAPHAAPSAICSCQMRHARQASTQGNLFVLTHKKFRVV